MLARDRSRAGRQTRRPEKAAGSNAGGTQNRPRTARPNSPWKMNGFPAGIHDLEKSNQAQAAQIDDLKRKAAAFADRTLFSAAEYAAWTQFINMNPDGQIAVVDFRGHGRRGDCGGIAVVYGYELAVVGKERLSWANPARGRAGSDEITVEFTARLRCGHISPASRLLLFR